MRQQIIESQDLALGDLFQRFYVVPSYQREYVWEAPQVEQFLTDIHDAYSSRSGEFEYFIGSIVVLKVDDEVYHLIDGQQRMTTSFLVLCAIRDYLQSIAPGTRNDSLDKLIASAEPDDEGQDIFRYRVSLQYEDSRQILELIASGASVGNDSDNTRSIRNILQARETISRFFSETFNDDFRSLQRFYKYFIHGVKLIRITTTSITHALKVFETINDRGVGLDSMDLLKNLLFMHAREKDFDSLKDKWKDLVDTLFNAREKPLRFIRYFITAEYDDVDNLREEEIYDWFVQNERQAKYTADPLGFVERLLSAARAYVNFVHGCDRTGQLNRYLLNIRQLSGSSRQHFVLLLSGRNLPADCFNELCRQVENLVFAYVMTRNASREFEQNNARWAKELRSVKDRAELDAFLLRNIQTAKETLAAHFEVVFSSLDEKKIQLYRLKYILAKLTQFIDVVALGGEGPENSIDTYINSKIEIEHILPRRPKKTILESFDKPEQIDSYIMKLGNLTLLERPHNSSIGNGAFEDKKRVYSDSRFYLTKHLGKPVRIGKNTSVDKAVQDLESFETWDSEAIERRQRMFLRLARRVWDIPISSQLVEISKSVPESAHVEVL